MEKLLFEIINEEANKTVVEENQSTEIVEEQSVQNNVDVQEIKEQEVTQEETNVDVSTEKEENIQTQTLFSKYKIHLNDDAVKKVVEPKANTQEQVEETKQTKNIVLETFKPKVVVKVETFKPQNITNKVIVEQQNCDVEENVFEKRIEKNIFSEKLNLFSQRIKENFAECERVLEKETKDPVLDAILEQLHTVQNLKNKVLNSSDISKEKLEEIEKILDRNISLLESGN